MDNKKFEIYTLQGVYYCYFSIPEKLNYINKLQGKSDSWTV